jgi:hypothetical protein
MSPQSVVGRQPTPDTIQLRIVMIRVVRIRIVGLREPSVHRMQTTEVLVPPDIAP